jgi:hypothetical protein
LAHFHAFRGASNTKIVHTVWAIVQLYHGMIPLSMDSPDRILTILQQHLWQIGWFFVWEYTQSTWPIHWQKYISNYMIISKIEGYAQIIVLVGFVGQGILN